MDPSDFYTGLVAEAYSGLRSAQFPAKPYADLIARHGQPALELGCGDGDPLLELRAAGLDVEGVDSSADMLERCRARARSRELEVSLHHQRMEELDLPRRFRTAFLAGPTLALVPDDETTVRALAGIGRHLTDDGRALVPMWVPPPMGLDELGVTRVSRLTDGTELRYTALSEDRDESARTRRVATRYERAGTTGTEVVERTWMLHWQTRASLRDAAARAGLVVEAVTDAEGAGEDDGGNEFALLLRRGDTASASLQRARRAGPGASS